jgi:hypothetical protein
MNLRRQAQTKIDFNAGLIAEQVSHVQEWGFIW